MAKAKALPKNPVYVHCAFPGHHHLRPLLVDIGLNDAFILVDNGFAGHWV
jgi:hypothetical protein